MKSRQAIADRLSEAGLDTRRFINVHDGEKRSTDHTKRGPNEVTGNYGVYAGGDETEGYLVDVDIDDYGAKDDEALQAVLSLPETLTVQSPHTDGETGGHRYYAVEGDVKGEIERVAGATNPAPTWGELRIENQYVVGPGSQLDGCGKDWCSECDDPDGGFYTISNDASIASIHVDDLVAVLEADGYDEEAVASQNETEFDTASVVDPDASFESRWGKSLDTLREQDEKLDDLLSSVVPSGYEYYNDKGEPDRSAADFAAVSKLWWHGFDEQQVADILRVYRYHEKLNRDDYLRVTVQNGCTGERWEPHEPEALVPEPNPEWDWRRERGVRLTKRDTHEMVQSAIERALTQPTDVLIEALPGMGKTTSTVYAAATTTEPVTMLLPRGHEEMYDEVTELGESCGLDVYQLPSFTKDCETAAGAFGDALQDQVWEVYNRGATGQEIHKRMDLPCTEEDGCTYQNRWSFNAENYDLLVGHYLHAHVGKAIIGRTVVFDEFPGAAFQRELDSQTVQQGVSQLDGVFEDFTDLIETRESEDRRFDATKKYIGPKHRQTTFENDVEQAFAEDGHTLAPVVLGTLLWGEHIGTGFERFEHDESVALYDRKDGRFFMLDPPDLGLSNGIVALDGTPTQSMWELAIGNSLHHHPVLETDEKRRAYIEDALNHEVVLCTEHINSAGGDGGYINVRKDGALFEEIDRIHDESPDLIAPRVAVDAKSGVYQKEDLLQFVNRTKYYGNLLGSNEFKYSRLGIVSCGCHYGDRFVERWAAYDGRSIQREGKGVDLTYNDDFADEVLVHMREHQTLQALLRFGRDGNGARVYVNTNTLPDWVPISSRAYVVGTRSDGEREVIDAIRSHTDRFSAGDVAEQVDLSQRRVYQILSDLQEAGYLSVESVGTAKFWSVTGWVSDYGEVELDTGGPVAEVRAHSVSDD